MLGALHNYSEGADKGDLLKEKGVEMGEGAVREMLSQMVKDGQRKNLGRGAYVHPNFQEYPDNADILTNGKGNVSLSGMSGHSRKDETR